MLVSKTHNFMMLVEMFMFPLNTQKNFIGIHNQWKYQNITHTREAVNSDTMFQYYTTPTHLLVKGPAYQVYNNKDDVIKENDIALHESILQSTFDNYVAFKKLLSNNLRKTLCIEIKDPKLVKSRIC